MTGYRAWALYPDMPYLVPLFAIGRMGRTWAPPGIATAARVRGPRFCPAPPDAECFCGLWMRSSLKELLDYLPFSGLALEFGTSRQSMRLVVGSVDAWGRIVEHIKGFRCQYMQITSFIHDAGVDDPRLPMIDLNTLWALSVRYDVPVIESDMMYV